MNQEARKMPQEDVRALHALLGVILGGSETEAVVQRMACRFSDLAQVLNADSSALYAVEGLSEQAVASVLCIGALFKRMRREQLRPGRGRKITLDNMDSFLRSYYVDKRHEVVVLLAFNDKREMVGFWEGNEGDTISAHANPADLYRFALLRGADSVALAHNHPGGKQDPSSSDFSFSSNLASGFEKLGITFRGSYLVAEGKISTIDVSR